MSLPHLGDSPEDKQSDASNRYAEMPRHQTVTELMNKDGTEKGKRADRPEDPIGQSGVIRNLKRKVPGR